MKERLKKPLSLLMAFVMTGAISVSALADEQDAVKLIDDDLTSFYSTGRMNYYENLDYYEGLNWNMPERFDLRDLDLVTSVKLQNPWGTCWSFATCAACESSILASLGTTNTEYTKAHGAELNISERQLAYFAHTPLSKEAASDSEESLKQVGEGCKFFGGKNAAMNGGFVVSATSVFGSGIGPVLDKYVPYRGKNGWTTVKKRKNGELVKQYSEDDDWRVPEADRFIRSYTMVNSNILPAPAQFDAQGNYHLSKAAMETMKSEIRNGRALSVAFCADTSRPGQEEEPKYINVKGDNPTWAHYTYTEEESNHAVCVVGWDDHYSRSNFLEGHQPPGDGAWIVKNSWGSLYSPEMNILNWGFNGTGYFYLSYYDMSISDVESFDIRDIDVRESVTIQDEYDFMPIEFLNNVLSKTKMSTANVFTTDYNEKLEAFAVRTGNFDDIVETKIYILEDGFTSPTDGTLVYSTTDKIKYAGYHRIELGSPIPLPKGTKYSIVQTSQCMTHSGNSYELSYNCVPRGDEEIGYVFTGIVNPGESFVFYDDTWYDWSNIVDKLKNDPTRISSEMEFDNFSMKGYCLLE